MATEHRDILLAFDYAINDKIKEAHTSEVDSL